jgi:tetratricopeptide (TPR) repeat protein
MAQAPPLSEQTRAGAAALDQAVGYLWRLRPEVVAAADLAMTLDPGWVMAVVLRAYLGLMSSEAPDARRAGALIRGLTGATDRERGHLAAAGLWAAGDWRGASRRLDEVLQAHPADALALLVGHQLDFFLGDAANLRARAQRALAGWDLGDPGRGFVLGMLAFGLEECGDYAAAMDAGLAAIGANPDDVWATHAVAHVYEMQGRPEEGLAFLRDRRGRWADGNFLQVHTAWHQALFHLELGDTDGVLEVYDTLIRPADAGDSAMELLDAAALLWRLWLDGVDTGGRFAPLAQAWLGKAPEESKDPGGWPSWYVFNDLHAVMALVGAGLQGEAEAVVRRLEHMAREGAPGRTNHAMVTGAGLAAAHGLAACGRGDYARVVAALAPVRDRLQVFGGSHAQRDVFQRTLLVAARRAGDTALARRLAQEHLAERPSSLWSRARLDELEAA